MDNINFEYSTQDNKDVVVENAYRIVVQDKDGHRYRIKADRFGGIEILAEDGRICIEPSVSNLVVVKTII